MFKTVIALKQKEYLGIPTQMKTDQFLLDFINMFKGLDSILKFYDVGMFSVEYRVYLK